MIEVKKNMKLCDIDVNGRKLIFEKGVEVPVLKGERVISAGIVFV